VATYGGTDGSTIGNDNGGAGNSNRFVHRFDGNTCGSSQPYFLHVERTADVATPFAYKLFLELTRDFQGRSIATFSPTSGPPGTAVTISGNFLIPVLVEFGGVEAAITSFKPCSSGCTAASDTITAIVPPGAKTGVITDYSVPSPQVFTVMAPAAVGPTGARAATLSPALTPATSGCCAVVPNPALVGRLGRLVVSFPPAAVPSNTSLAVIKDGKELQSGYGSQTWELLPGNYDLSVSGKTINSVAVQARADTNVRVGVLRISAGSQTHWEVLDGGTAIANGYGSKLVGLPVGSYGLRISGQTESFAIRDGEVTDF